MDGHDDKTRERDMVLSPGASTEEAASSEIDPVAEQKLIRKLDRHIIPIVMLLYVFSFLDRQVNSMHTPSFQGLFSDGQKASMSGMRDCMGWRKILA